MKHFAALFLAFGALGACSTSPQSHPPEPMREPSVNVDPAREKKFAEDQLELVYYSNRGDRGINVMLSCGEVESHPEACTALRQLDPGIFSTPPAAVCRLIYGGPEVLTVEGRWRKKDVAYIFSREDGCKNDHWKTIEPVIAELGIDLDFRIE